MSARYARLDTEMGDLNKEGSLATGLSGEQLSQDRKHGKGRVVTLLKMGMIGTF